MIAKHFTIIKVWLPNFHHQVYVLRIQFLLVKLSHIWRISFIYKIQGIENAIYQYYLFCWNHVEPFTSLPKMQSMFTFSDRKPQTDSVYDFHDDSDADEDDNILTIDESPKKRRWNKNSTTTASSEGLPAAAKSKWGQSNHTQIHLSEFTFITCCC